MRFQIVGAHAESGDDVNVMLEASTRTDVEKLAHDRGILVSTITPLNGAEDHGHGGQNGAPQHAPLVPKQEAEAIALVDDDPPANGADHPGDAKVHGYITVNANSPSETGQTSAGHLNHEHKEASAEYHIIMNQSLYLLETAVNKHLRDGWEPQGGLSVGVSNNAMQYFQSMIRHKAGPPPLAHKMGE